MLSNNFLLDETLWQLATGAVYAAFFFGLIWWAKRRIRKK